MNTTSSVAFPEKNEPPIVVNMETNACVYGKVEIAERKKESVPEDWIFGKHGNVVEHPEEMIDGGTLLPLGRF